MFGKLWSLCHQAWLRGHDYPNARLASIGLIIAIVPYFGGMLVLIGAMQLVAHVYRVCGAEPSRFWLPGFNLAATIVFWGGLPCVFLGQAFIPIAAGKAILFSIRQKQNRRAAKDEPQGPCER